MCDEMQLAAAVGKASGGSVSKAKRVGALVALRRIFGDLADGNRKSFWREVRISTGTWNRSCPMSLS